MQEALVFAAVHATSYEQASQLVAKLKKIMISAKQLSRMTTRIGAERVAERDTVVAAYEARPLTERKAAPKDVTPPEVAAVMVDGGRLQILERTQSADRPAPTVAAPTDESAEAETGSADAASLKGHWREDQIGLTMTLKSAAHASDPCPEIPAHFVEPKRILKLTRELKPVPGSPPADDIPATATAMAATAAASEEWEPPAVQTRQVAATRSKWAAFGPMLAASAWEQGFFAAERKVFVGDGSSSNWTLWRQRFSSFTPILDFIHALSYVYAAATAGRPFDDGWQAYVTWITWIWQGEVAKVIAAVAQRQQELGLPADADADTSPRRMVADAWTYLQNQQSRMRYPEYRTQGMPITSSHIESAIKQINRRVKGTEKFWSEQGSEGMLQLRADILSDAHPLDAFWQRRQDRESGQRRYQLAA